VCWVTHMCIQGGVESYDALSLQGIFRKRALYIVALLRKMTCNLRHPMTLHYPVTVPSYGICVLVARNSYMLLVARDWYGVASTSTLLRIIGLFCKRALQKRRYSAKETYNFKEPTNRSHPIHVVGCTELLWGGYD